MKTLNSAKAVIEALGGDVALAWMLSTTKSAVSNWRCWNKFPANTYLAIEHELQIRGYEAPGGLWAMRQRRKRRIRDNERVDQGGSR